MTSETFAYRLEQPADAPVIDRLHASLFGPQRFKRAAYVLRAGVPPDAKLCFVATAQGRLVASVRMTPITIGGRPALILGPLVVDPAYKGMGAGRALVRMACAEAARQGHRVVMLVGDLPYYGPLGFTFLGRDVITPLDLERTYGLTGGHIFHSELALDQLFVARPLLGSADYSTPIRQLYLCGSGTHPGTGTSGRSGALAARAILKAR